MKDQFLKRFKSWATTILGILTIITAVVLISIGKIDVTVFSIVTALGLGLIGVKEKLLDRFKKNG